MKREVERWKDAPRRSTPTPFASLSSSNLSPLPSTPPCLKVLTGFLGSGKTTLLNHLLSQPHGKRLAIIENEFGEIDIDSELVAVDVSAGSATLAGAPSGSTAERIVSLSNGCLCCTVRGDLIDALVDLAGRAGEFDALVLETTGLANPAPIIETFQSVDAVARSFRLDGVVTLVDALHAPRHLGEAEPGREPSEAVAQVAYADRLVLNKTDLVTGADADALAARLASLNGLAPILRTTKASVSADWVLGVGGYDLEAVEGALEGGGGGDEAVAAASPSAHPAHGEAGHVCGSSDCGHEHGHEHEHEHGHEHAHGEHAHGAAHAHSNDDAHAAHDHASHSPHPSHDDSISSVSLTLPGDMDLAMVNAWLGALLEVRADDLYRFKGILAIKGYPRRYVFQGVHALFAGEPGREWGDGEARVSRMVFIGRELDAGLLREGFEECLSVAEGVAGKAAAAGVRG